MGRPRGVEPSRAGRRHMRALQDESIPHAARVASCDRGPPASASPSGQLRGVLVVTSSGAWPAGPVPVSPHLTRSQRQFVLTDWPRRAALVGLDVSNFCTSRGLCRAGMRRITGSLHHTGLEDANSVAAWQLVVSAPGTRWANHCVLSVSGAPPRRTRGFRRLAAHWSPRRDNSRGACR
jgi:hypothetical protein